MRWMIEMMMSNVTHLVQGGLAASSSDVGQVLVLEGVCEARELVVLLLHLRDRSGVSALQHRVDIGGDLADVIIQFGQCSDVLAVRACLARVQGELTQWLL